MNTTTQQPARTAAPSDAPAASLPATSAPAATGNRKAVARIAPPRLPYHPIIGERFGVDPATWKALCESLYPLAKTTDAVCLALAYCKARKLDIMKKPVHIVPMWNGELGREVETVWPAITEHRITAHRTEQYAGTEPTHFGPTITETFEAEVKRGKAKGKKLKAVVSFPEWAEITVYRLVQGQKMAFPGPRIYYREFYGMTMGEPVPNSRWTRSPSQMLEKCAEAAALRKAFTEELGGEPVAEEMEGRIIEQVLAAIHGKRPDAPKTGSDHFTAESEVIDESEPAAEKGEGWEDGEVEEAEEEAPVQAAVREETSRKAEPEKLEPERDRVAEWLVDKIREVAGAKDSATVIAMDDAVRSLLRQENRERDLLALWEAAAKECQAAIARGTPAEHRRGEAVVPAAEKADLKEQEYQAWKASQYELLNNAKMTRTVDELQDTILADMREADRGAWNQACNAKAKELLSSKGGRK